MDRGLKLEYVRQAPGDLVYWLFEGAAPRAFVKVVLERRLAVPAGEVALAIIGSSHFLEIRTGGSVVTEMLASARPGLDGLLTARGVKSSRSGVRLVRDHLSYHCSLEEVRYGKADFERDTLRLSTESPQRIFFPFPAGDEGLGAVTCLDWSLEGRAFELNTYHTFPGESTIVRSRTVIGFPERGGTP